MTAALLDLDCCDEVTPRRVYMRVYLSLCACTYVTDGLFCGRTTLAGFWHELVEFVVELLHLEIKLMNVSFLRRKLLLVSLLHKGIDCCRHVCHAEIWPLCCMGGHIG